MKLSRTPNLRLSLVLQRTPFQSTLRTSSTPLLKSKTTTTPTRHTSTMQSIKNTIAENAGKIVSNSHSLAPSDSQFSLSQVPDLSGKVAVVTGGSEGIGYGVTHTLLNHNISKLFILSKSDDIVEEAIGAIRKELGDEKAERVECIQCDLSDWDEVARVAKEDIAAKTDRIDILINSAARGIMSVQLAKNGVDLHMAINHIGHVVLTSHLLPVLKKTAENGNTVRIVNMASNLHENAPKETKFESIEELNTDYGAQPQYGRTKLAAILYSKYLHRHLHSAYPNILANATHPGIVETRQTTEHIHDAFPLGGYAMSVGMSPFKKTQFEGAVSMMFAATTTEKSGEYICPPAIVEKGSDKANDEALSEKLMELTQKVVQEKTKSQSPLTLY